ncbi:MAG: DEAD/DEAH box helicase [Candidatus Gracilibacteria bacterium]|nr:DEAD/DEAH box helicase [Candidatus Gracilibacteria bacterium]
MQFSDLPIIEPILRAIDDEGYTTPTPIQAAAIPTILSGRDFLGCAQTGTGKTAAFAIPILQLLYAKKDPNKGKWKIKTLIVTPTRELAIQIEESFRAYGRYAGLHQAVIFGGVKQGNQVERLRQGVDILIATPGRLLDLMGQGYVSLADIEIFVLDEADRMLDMGFINDIKKLLKVIPVKRQTLFFSATMAPDIMTLAGTILRNPEKIEITPVSTTAETITQSVYHVDKGNKNSLIVHLLENPKIKNVLVFTRTKHGADKVVKFLVGRGIVAEAIHGNKSQNNRQRALSNFKEQTTRVLVATDIASRGIDIDELEYMINYDIPNISETYVHRIGRTGRAGAKGVAISFCDNDDIAHLRDIEKLISQKIPVVEDHPFPRTGVVSPIQSKAPQGKAGGGRGRGSSDPRFQKTPGDSRFSSSRAEGHSHQKPRTSERIHGAGKSVPSHPSSGGSYSQPSGPGNRPSGPKGGGAKKGYFGGR